MSDFELQWQKKFQQSITDVLGEHHLFSSSPGNDADSASLTVRAMLQLEEIAGPDQLRDIMTSCACRYPSEELVDIRRRYKTTGDLKTVHRMLQEKFEDFLITALKLPMGIRREIISRNWGLAGKLEGKTVTATKIPKSGSIHDYFAAEDSKTRRAPYCHCPRIREALAQGVPFSPLYCYCGAGFYKGIWEDITGGPGQVKLLKSITAGDDACSFKIYIQP